MLQGYFQFARNIYNIYKLVIIVSQEILLCLDQIEILKIIAPQASVSLKLQNRNQRKGINFEIYFPSVLSLLLQRPTGKISNYIYIYLYIALCVYIHTYITTHIMQIISSCFYYHSVIRLYHRFFLSYLYQIYFWNCHSDNKTLLRQKENRYFFPT